MAKLPIDNRLKIEIKIEDEKIEKEFRPYLGFSQIADPCPRKLWYNFRFCKKIYISARQQRLFQRGHREESIIIKDLLSIGIKVWGVLEDQVEVITGNGHIKGHGDGFGIGIPDAPKTVHLFEFKTGNDKNFNKTKKEGVKLAHPEYYGQICCYMHLYGVKRTLFIMVNKNNDDRYYERLVEDPGHAHFLINRGIDIISSELPPEKIGDQTWYQCKYCDYCDICHFGAAIYETCRNCTFGYIYNEGVWKCSRYGNLELTHNQQIKGCEKYEKLNFL